MLGGSLKLRTKLVVMGDSGVGKTALTQVFHSNGQKFPKNYLMTIGVDFCMKPVQVAESSATVELYLFDTAGQDLFAEMAPHFWEGTASLVLVYDVTRPESLEHLGEWVERISRVVPVESLLGGCVVANKADLNERAEISREAGEAFARRYGFAFFECSALEHQGVEAPFAHIAAVTHRRYAESLEKLAALS
ncbi:small GTPase superfamily [Pavlovales sp. CCMP2436]|nr:small GTPase superfamily [Pavlovales sp. CCMP2436]|mmetsp:Transcript_32815/g.81536  ORF Transcript_32815/g.81536 Transcript_32815/m.81536 type:complete len:192 (-) Transcript_32815:73-648(-)